MTLQILFSELAPDNHLSIVKENKCSGILPHCRFVKKMIPLKMVSPQRYPSLAPRAYSHENILRNLRALRPPSVLPSVLLPASASLLPPSSGGKKIKWPKAKINQSEKQHTWTRGRDCKCKTESLHVWHGERVCTCRAGPPPPPHSPTQVDRRRCGGGAPTLPESILASSPLLGERFT